jgi:hypothetical protein
MLETDKLRIFISDDIDRARSQCWYFHSKGDDVYIGPEATGGTAKLSLHGNNAPSNDGCNSQWGLIGDYRKKEAKFTNRPLRPLRWKRPKTPPMGAIHVASILFPTDFLCGVIRAFKPGRTRVALPMAPPRHAIEVSVIYSLEEPSNIAAEMTKAGITFLGHFHLPCGGIVAVSACEVPFDPALVPPPSALGRGFALTGAPASGKSIGNCGAVIVHAKPEDGQSVTLAEINGYTVKRN